MRLTNCQSSTSCARMSLHPGVAVSRFVYKLNPRGNDFAGNRGLLSKRVENIAEATSGNRPRSSECARFINIGYHEGSDALACIEVLR